MAKYMDANFKKTLSALQNQQKAYLSGCCRSGGYLDAAEKLINCAMLKMIEDLAVDDIMNGGEHNIKNLSSNPSFPVLAVDNMIFCSYQTAKKWELLQTLGCPLDGSYSSIEDGGDMVRMITDLQILPLAEFAKKYYIEGEYFNGSARLISMLEKVYTSDDFSESSYSSTSVIGSVKFENRAKAAVMQFINANTANAARYENGTLFYSDKEIKTVGAELGFTRSSTSEDFTLTKLTLQLFVDEECSSHFPFAIAVGAGERQAACSFGRMFTASTFPKFAKDADSNAKFVWHIPQGMIREKACGGPSDKRTINQLIADYEEIRSRTSTPEFLQRLINNRLSAEDEHIAKQLTEYGNFIDEWRNALNFVQYSTLTFIMPNSWRSDNYRVGSLLESQEEYIRLFTMLTGGFGIYVRPMLMEDMKCPENITDYITYEELRALSNNAQIQFREEMAALNGGRPDLCDVLTVPELMECINATKPLRQKHGIRDTSVITDTVKALFKAERERTSSTLLQCCKRSYVQLINEPENEIHKIALDIGYYLYCNATWTVGEGNVLVPAGRIDYQLEEENNIHEIYIRMAPQKPMNRIILRIKNGMVLDCSNEIFISRDEEYSYSVKTQFDIDSLIPYPEIRTLLEKYVLGRDA